MKVSAPSAYIHIPFCKSKCFYCDFNSYIGQEALFDDYFAAVCREIVLLSKKLELSGTVKRKFETVFFGGGTPSYVPSKYIRLIMETLRQEFGFTDNCEITIECNPGTITAEKIHDYFDCGINRYSVGLQSSSNKLLSLAGRSHNLNDFAQTIELFKSYNISNINADLIIGLPEQTIEDVVTSVEYVINAGVMHVSLYSLSVEEGTPFFDEYSVNDSRYPEPDIERSMYHTARNLLTANGFEQYEISNFAKPGNMSRHNYLCWKAIEYFGFGAGAHSYYEYNRYSNLEDISEYISRINSPSANAIHTSINLSVTDSINEYIMLGLRLIEGINMSEVVSRFGSLDAGIYTKLNDLVTRGLLINSNDSYKLSEYGLDYANQAFMEFL